jgi:cytosine permease
MAENLPGFITAAKPVPLAARGPWYKNTAPTYAGIFLWFVFWDSMSLNGLPGGGLVSTLLGILIAGVICHLLFYMAPGLLGLKTGLPLYVVGTSTFGTVGGLLMPGFLMGILQFGWLGVSTFYSSQALADGFKVPDLFWPLCIVWAAGAAFVGLKGIQYVAKVATFLPLIPLAVLVVLLVTFGFSAGEYKGPHLAAGVQAPAATGSFTAILGMVTAIVGFFATAGAAGVDFGMNNRNKKDVNRGGIVGILVAILVTSVISTLAVAGAHATGALTLTGSEGGAVKAAYTATNALKGRGAYPIIMIGLTIASFPGACFSAFIAANSFKTVMPKVNPFVSVGIGAIVSMVLALKGWAGDLGSVFEIIGASFGPIVGAMTVDYLLAGGKWAGPRAGWNVAGWGAWLLGFIVGILPTIGKVLKVDLAVPCAPVLAFVVGAVVYFVLAKAGLESQKLPMPPTVGPAEGAASGGACCAGS